MEVKRKILEKNGSTIVEVLIALVVLLLVTLMLTSSLSAALNLTKTAQRLDVCSNEALKQYYLKKGEETVGNPESTLQFRRGSQTFDIPVQIREYDYTDDVSGYSMLFLEFISQ